ncbi:hypothetical protein [Clostridium akagii]|uniref:hypothetical protein n=1 Tax=Clostridium akagii TaxID=91623 RepID=UPI00047DB522|nr:hypothetical protein [Clostridium akagii]
MNKKIMSMAAITMTMITVCIMLYNYKYCNYNRQLGYSTIKDNKAINKNSSDGGNKNIVPNGTSSLDNTVKNGNNNLENTAKNSTDNSENKSNTNSATQNQNGNSTIENQQNKTDNIKNNEVNSEKNNKPIFKISKDKIMDKLSFTDKAKILSISRSLSPTDFSKLQNDVNSDDEKKGIVSAMTLLRRRLDDEDYGKLKNIASKFINLDALNY